MPTRVRAHKRNKSNPPKAKAAAKKTVAAKPSTPKMTPEQRAAAKKEQKAVKVAERERIKDAAKAVKDAEAAIKRAASEHARALKASGGSKDRRWVDKIVDHRQRALARVIPDICAIFGMEPDDLIGRTAAETPAEMVINSHRKTCTGAIIYLGLSLGIRWNALHGRPAAVGQSGETEIRDLVDAHRQSLASFRLQFCALAGFPASDENPAAGQPMGEIGALVRARFAPIRAAAFAEVGQAHAVADEEVAA